MVVSGTAAYGMYPPNAVLPDVVCTLNSGGFNNEDICMVVSPTHPIADVMRNAKIEDGLGRESAETVRTIGWFSKLGAVIIPSVGFFIRSQAYLRALLNEQDFSTPLRDCNTLAGLGFAEREAKRLFPFVSGAGAMVYVSCSGNMKAESAIELLRRAGASEVARVSRAKTVEATA